MTATTQRTLAVLASGTGSNAMAIADACERGDIPAPLACIVTDRCGAPVIERARARGIDVVVVEWHGRADADAHDARIVAELRRRDVEWVVLAGYMRMCGPAFLDAFAGRAVNVHPSMLPAFPGRDAIGDALVAGVDSTGVSVHFLDAGMDTGPIIWQTPVRIEANEPRAALADRIHTTEHRLLPAVVSGLVTGEIALIGERDVAIAPRLRAHLDSTTPTPTQLQEVHFT